MWRELLTHNRWQKVFSLLLASLIWLAVRPGSGLSLRVEDPGLVERPFTDLPITVLTPAADLGRYRVAPDKITLVLRGDPAVIDRLKPAELEVYVNLVEPGPDRFTRIIHVHAPAGTEVVTVSPAEVQIERLASALVPPAH